MARGRGFAGWIWSTSENLAASLIEIPRRLWGNQDNLTEKIIRIQRSH